MAGEVVAFLLYTGLVSTRVPATALIGVLVTAPLQVALFVGFLVVPLRFRGAGAKLLAPLMVLVAFVGYLTFFSLVPTLDGWVYAASDGFAALLRQ